MLFILLELQAHLQQISNEAAMRAQREYLGPRHPSSDEDSLLGEGRKRKLPKRDPRSAYEMITLILESQERLTDCLIRFEKKLDGVCDAIKTLQDQSVFPIAGQILL